MQIIEIIALSNGAHRNQSFHGSAPEGWAVIPEGLDTENFPFGEITVETIDGIPTVTSWTPGTMPAPEPPPEPGPTVEERVTALEETSATKDEVQAVWDSMAAAYSEGVNQA